MPASEVTVTTRVDAKVLHVDVVGARSWHNRTKDAYPAMQCQFCEGHMLCPAFTVLDSATGEVMSYSYPLHCTTCGSMTHYADGTPVPAPPRDESPT